MRMETIIPVERKYEIPTEREIYIKTSLGEATKKVKIVRKSSISFMKVSHRLHQTTLLNDGKDFPIVYFGRYSRR